MLVLTQKVLTSSHGRSSYGPPFIPHKSVIKKKKKKADVGCQEEYALPNLVEAVMSATLVRVAVSSVYCNLSIAQDTIKPH